jgi:hypothetical protein
LKTAALEVRTDRGVGDLPAPVCRIPPVQVAAWAGRHSVEILLRIFANVIGGYENRWQVEIDKFLGE